MKFNETFLDAIQARIDTIEGRMMVFLRTELNHLLKDIKECEFCGDTFLVKRSDAKYCGRRCNHLMFLFRQNRVEKEQHNG